MPSPLTYKNSNSRSSKRPGNTAIFRSSSLGQEKDSETGYYYFGARYYNSDLSLWLSVDQMADKYPSLYFDQERPRDLGVPSYLYNGGEVRRFDEVVRPRNLNPTEFGRIFGLCHYVALPEKRTV